MAKRKPKLDNVIVRMSDGSPIPKGGLPKVSGYDYTALHYETPIPKEVRYLNPYKRGAERLARQYPGLHFPDYNFDDMDPIGPQSYNVFDVPKKVRMASTPYKRGAARVAGAYPTMQFSDLTFPDGPIPMKHGFGAPVGKIPQGYTTSAASRMYGAVGGSIGGAGRVGTTARVIEGGGSIVGPGFKNPAGVAATVGKAGRFMKFLSRGLGVLGLLGVSQSILADVQKERMARFMSEMETRKRLEFGNTLRQEEWLAKFLDSEDRLDAAIGRAQRAEELQRVNRDAVIAARSAKLRNASVQQPPGALELELMLNQLRESEANGNG